MQRNTITMYHGTSSKNVPSIEASGLKPGAAKGADTWAQNNGWRLAKTSAKRKPSVFVSRTYGDALYFAELSAEINDGKPTILRLEIPRDKFKAEFVPDELEAPGASVPYKWRTTEAIPPAWIVDAQRAKPGEHAIAID